METESRATGCGCGAGATQVVPVDVLTADEATEVAVRMDADVPHGSSTTPSCCGGETHNPWGYAEHKQDYVRRLRRIEGQVRGLQRMVDEDQYCIDILTQISAVTKALESTALKMLDEHLSHCVTHAIEAGGQEAEDKLAEASAAIARLVRS